MILPALAQLDGILSAYEIPHEVIDLPEMAGGQIAIPDYNAFALNDGISIIEHEKSMGFHHDRLEVWCKTGKRRDKTPIGYLTPELAYKLIKEAVG